MSDDPSLWVQLFTAKSPEAWLSIIGGGMYVWYKSGSLTRIGKAIEAGISVLISIAVVPDIVAVTSYPAAILHFLVAVFGFLAIDIAMSVFSDKTELANIGRAFLKKWLGLGKGSGDK